MNKPRWKVFVTKKASGEVLFKKLCMSVDEINEPMAALLGLNWRDQVDINTDYDFTGLPGQAGRDFRLEE